MARLEHLAQHVQYVKVYPAHRHAGPRQAIGCPHRQLPASILHLPRQPVGCPSPILEHFGKPKSHPATPEEFEVKSSGRAGQGRKAQDVRPTPLPAPRTARAAASVGALPAGAVRQDPPHPPSVGHPMVTSRVRRGRPLARHLRTQGRAGVPRAIAARPGGPGIAAEQNRIASWRWSRSSQPVRSTSYRSNATESTERACRCSTVTRRAPSAAPRATSCSGAQARAPTTISQGRFFLRLGLSSLVGADRRWWRSS